MSLFSVPFYPSLVGKEIEDVKLTTGYVLLIGAIIAHSNGKFNCCVASVDVLAEETGLNEKKVKNYRSELIRVGVIEVLERDRSNYIVSTKINDGIVCELLKSGGTPFPKLGKPFPQKGETQTEMETGVGDNNNRKEDDNNERARMKSSVLYTRLKSIYHIRKDADKKNCIRAIEKLQETFDDDTIIEAARHFYSVDRKRPRRFEDGSSWWPDFFWVLDPNKTEKVVQQIKGIANLFRDDVEEDNKLKTFVKITDM